MNSAEIEIGNLISQFERLMKKQLVQIPYPTNAQYNAAIEAAFFVKRKEIEEDIKELERDMIKAGKVTSKMVEVANQLRIRRWQAAIAQLEGTNGLGYACIYAKN